MRKDKIGRNELCPCGTGKKYKHCCLGNVDWDDIFRNQKDWRPHMSIRGRNIAFANRLGDILNLNNVNDIVDYKKGFTNQAVREIHETVLDLWPLNLDIEAVLERSRDDVSGLYVGDYDLDYVLRGVVRHSIYANKILLVDPFVYPPSVRDAFNPLLEPGQYRGQDAESRGPMRRHSRFSSRRGCPGTEPGDRSSPRSAGRAARRRRRHHARPI